ncbi:hypothetical protein AG1IA_03754 [Rhizoctonia solani AG-1 IA]|uniref:Uncharacterized protein n=1 Tax=Thanatephorus cucumeris (strain AG1-IA) TaxID=983506 RepID=L8WZL2_THACA|nr:hypothetical protein AG1IA_03754 [Rhizoctonia solani AG-1 IA]
MTIVPGRYRIKNHASWTTLDESGGGGGAISGWTQNDGDNHGMSTSGRTALILSGMLLRDHRYLRTELMMGARFPRRRSELAGMLSSTTRDGLSRYTHIRLMQSLKCAGLASFTPEAVTLSILITAMQRMEHQYVKPRKTPNACNEHIPNYLTDGHD